MHNYRNDQTQQAEAKEEKENLGPVLTMQLNVLTSIENNLFLVPISLYITNPPTLLYLKHLMMHRKQKSQLTQFE